MRIEEFDYRVGDIVQIKQDKKHTGRIGMIISIKLVYDHSNEPMLMYVIKLSDNESAACVESNITFIRRGEND